MNKNVPKLRFKEFSDELKQYRFKDVVKLKRGSSPRPIIKYITDNDDGVNWIKIGDVSKGEKIITSTKEKITKEGAEKSRYVEVGDLILSNSMSYGRPYIMGIDGYIHDGWFVLKDYEENFNREYLCQILISPTVQKQYKKLAAGGVVDNISSELVNSVNINLPSLEEQERIGNFFSIIDKLIEEQEGKVRDLELYKKGMMQKIFKQEIRFKDDNGLDYPAWEEKMVCKLGDIITGTTPPKSNLDYYYNGVESKFTWITPTDIKRNKNIYEGAISLTKKGYNTCRKLPVNTVLVTCIASIGKNAILKNVGSCNQQINAIITNKENYYEFIYYLMEYNSCTLKRFAGITATPILNKTDFSRLIFNIPSLEEQIKIANFLSNIDNLTEEEQKNLDDLRKMKKGLLQQMFV